MVVHDLPRFLVNYAIPDHSFAGGVAWERDLKITSVGSWGFSLSQQELPPPLKLPKHNLTSVKAHLQGGDILPQKMF